MWAELRTLFWLQGRLTWAMFRGRRTRIQIRALSLVGRLLMVIFSLPIFVLMGGGLAVLLILLSPGAAFEFAMMANTFMFFIWLLAPSSYSSQLVERFQMSQLFVYPISFRGLVVGSTLMSFLTMTGLWTVPVLLGEIIGLAWHRPAALLLIIPGAIPVLVLLALTGRIMDDFFDLVSNDRRLRAIAVALLTVPFMLCGFSQFFIQQLTDDYSQVPGFIPQAMVEEWETEFQDHEDPADVEGAFQAISRAMEIVRISRLLIWLPSGWATAGMGMAVTGEWGWALLFLALSLAFTALLLRVHAGITRRLMQGVALSIGEEKVRKQRRFQGLPGPPIFWALFQKDWAHLWRNPVVRQMVLPSLMLVAVAGFVIKSFSPADVSPDVYKALPLLAAAIVIVLISFITNLSLTANYFGVMDREGFATLAGSPADRRWILISANFTIFLFFSLQTLIITVTMAVVSGVWQVIPLGLYLGLCTQVGSSPAFNLAAILVPYRMKLQFSNNRQGNIWGMLAWLVAAPPVLAVIVVPYILWKPGLILTLPLGLIYCVGVYWLSLKPLARLMQRREYHILEAVSTED